MKRLTITLVVALIACMTLSACGAAAPSSVPQPDSNPASQASKQPAEEAGTSSEINIEPTDYSIYEGWVEIDGVQYALGDTVDKFVENGWEAVPDLGGKNPYPEMYTAGSAGMVILNFTKGDVRMQVTADGHYPQEDTPTSELMIDSIGVGNGVSWKTDVGLTNDTPFSEIPSFYPDSEQEEGEKDEYHVYYAGVDDRHPWLSMGFSTDDGNSISFLYLSFDLYHYMADKQG